jgi:hypothetical protein
MRIRPKRPNSARKVGIRKVIVPDLSGLSRSQAKTALESVGLTWSETASNIENINIDQSIVNQGTSSGVTVNIGTSISFTYYNYVAPPPYYNPYYNPYNNPPPYDNTYYNPYSNPPVSDCIDDDAGFCTNVDANGYGDGYNYQYSPSGLFNCSPRYYGRTFCGIPAYYNPYNNPYYNPYDNPPPYDNTYYNPYNNPPPYINSPSVYYNPYYNPSFAKSIGVNTLIRTPSGLVAAGSIQPGDILSSANIVGFPYENLPGAKEEALAWTSDNPVIEPAETTVVSVVKRTAEGGVLINTDVFSETHYILVKRNSLAMFVLTTQVVTTDEVYSYATQTWEKIVNLQAENIPHEVVSINCEPYDIFYTERMLVHDSVSL